MISATAEANETKATSKTTYVTAPSTASEVVLVVSVGYDVSIEYTYQRTDAAQN